MFFVLQDFLVPKLIGVKHLVWCTLLFSYFRNHNKTKTHSFEKSVPSEKGDFLELLWIIKTLQ